MPPRRRPISVPTAASLPPTLRLPSTNARVRKSLSRLSRPALLSLALEWILNPDQTLCGPYLLEDGTPRLEDDLYPPCATLEELRELYESLQASKGVKREIVDRILEGEWRYGLTLWQLAEADMRYLAEKPATLRWTAMKLVRRDTPLRERKDANERSHLPRFHGPTFLRNLQREIGAVFKAHYHLPPPIPTLQSLPILRLSLHSTPYAHPTPLVLSTQPPKTIYLAFPPSTPHIYISISLTAITTNNNDKNSLTSLLLSAIPKAFSRPHCRYDLRSTGFSTRDLNTLLSVRGKGRESGAQGGWSVYADGSVEGHPLDVIPRKRKASLNEDDEKENSSHGPGPDSPATKRSKKRRKALAQSRFGSSGLSTDEKPVERFAAIIEDPFPSDPSSSRADNHPQHQREGDERGAFRPRVRVLFHGRHVFAGIRRLVETGVVDGVGMPGWMTGEAGVTGGKVTKGRMRGWEDFNDS